MTDDLDKLKQDYRAVEAPPHLATRIKARVSERSDRNRAWVPAAVTMVLAIGIAIPMLWQQTTLNTPADDATRTTQPSTPSLSALASLTPDRPKVATPSLSQLRSVPVPRLPPRPQINTQRPQSSLDTEHENSQEKHHANA